MRVQWRAVCAFFLLTLAAGCGPGEKRSPGDAPVAAAPAAPEAKDSGVRRPTLLFVGTSITAGLGLDPVVNWASLVQQKVDSSGYTFRVINAGVSGETSSGALHRIDWLLQQPPPPQLVLIETGANDGLRGQPADSVRANLEALVRRVEEVSPRPVIVIAGMEALPNLGRRYAEEFRTVFPAVAKAHHAVFLPFLLTGVAGVDSLNQADGIHPNPSGSVVVAANVWRVLKPILDSIARSGHAGL